MLLGLSLAIPQIPRAVAAGATFPYPGAALDLDFINQRYWWGGSLKTSANFTTYTLGSATFGANGLTPADNMDMTIALAGVGTVVPGCLAISFRNNSNPASVRQWCSLDDGTAGNRIIPIENTTSTGGFIVTTATVQQANVTAAGVSALATPHGMAISYALNDFKFAADGVALTADVAGTLPTVTTLRIGEGVGASGPASTGTIGRILLFASAKTQAEVNALSTAMQGLPSVWTPLDLGANLKGWWNAADHGTGLMVDDGAGLISSWADRVVNLALTGTTTARPTWASNSFNSAYPAVVGDGVANVLSTVTLTSLPTAATAGFIAVLGNNTTPGATAGTQRAFQYGGTAGAVSRAFQRVSSASVNRGQGTDGSTNLSNLTVDIGNPTISIYTFNGTTLGGRVNGTPLTPATMGALATGTTRLSMFASNATTPAFFWTGPVAEGMIGLDLATADYQRIEGDWAYRYGLQSVLPVGHPYKSTRP